MVLHVLSVGRHTSYDTTILNVRIVQAAHPLIARSMDSFPCRAVLGCAAAGCKAVVASKVRRHKRASSHADTRTLHNDRKLHAKDAVTHDRRHRAGVRLVRVSKGHACAHAAGGLD